MKHIIVVTLCVITLVTFGMERAPSPHHRRTHSNTTHPLEPIDLEVGKPDAASNPVVMNLSGGTTVPPLNFSELDQQKQELKEMADAALEAKFGPDHKLDSDCRRRLKKLLKEKNKSAEKSDRDALASLRQLSTDRKTRRAPLKTQDKADSSSQDSDKKSELHPDIDSMITTAISNCIQGKNTQIKWTRVGAVAIILPTLTGLMTAYLKQCTPLGNATNSTLG